MDIIASFSNWPFTILAALIGILGALYVRHRNNFTAAAAAFRAAFNDTLLRLTTSHDATSIIIFQNHRAHLAAIIAFRPYVVWYRRHNFERAIKNYSLQANIQNAKGPLEGLIFDGTQKAQAQRDALLSSVQKLLSYASEI